MRSVLFATKYDKKTEWQILTHSFQYLLHIRAPLSAREPFKHNYQMLGWERHKLPYVKTDTFYDSLLFSVTDFYRISAWQVLNPGRV